MVKPGCILPNLWPRPCKQRGWGWIWPPTTFSVTYTMLKTFWKCLIKIKIPYFSWKNKKGISGHHWIHFLYGNNHPELSGKCPFWTEHGLSYLPKSPLLPITHPWLASLIPFTCVTSVFTGVCKPHLEQALYFANVECGAQRHSEIGNQ